MAMRGISGDAHFFEESMNLDRIRKLLDNKLGVAGHSEKLEAMKTLLASISKGEDVSMFFADVVKNVIVASVEVKKLVYMYLVHYADANAQCRELALLSINSFQKDLADANQLIRALALRVMTSIRVRDILQIQLIAIRKCAADSSPYVRKCAANAISKVYAVDADQKDVLAEIIGKLLHDASTMVLGSAMQALNEVCPERLDLVHRPFRKICHLLADIEEWGQVVTINVLIRYCREQFQTPEVMNLEDAAAGGGGRSGSGGGGGGKNIKTLFPKRKTKRGFYSDDEGGNSDSETRDKNRMNDKTTGASPFHLGSASAPRGEELPSIGSVFRSNALASGIGGGEELDEDHRLLLRSSIPLLKSRNSAVVLAVATLHYYCGTHSVATNTLIGKSLVRIMRNQREIQYVVLTVISSMAVSRADMFRPFLQDFFVRATDPSYARKLKLEILTALVTDENVSIILREFQAYVRHVDKAFVTMTVRALGRVADAMPSVAERCLNGLMRLVRSNNEQVVAESVVVIRQLMQQSAVEKDRMRVVRSLAAMMVSSRVTSPSARASIVWMLGEFHQEGNGWVCAAETLRLVAKTFADEATEVRLQVLNLAVKLGLHEPQQRNIQLLLQYVIELSKFDPDYDVRDRARLIRAALSGDANVVNPHTIFATKKPAPLVGYEEESKSRFTLGTLSSVVHHSVPGYAPLPTWRQTKPDHSLRDESSYNDNEPEDTVPSNCRGGGGGRGATGKPKDSRKVKASGFYSSSDGSGSESESESDSGSDADSDAESESGSDAYSGSESESESDGDDDSGESEEEDDDESSEDSEEERRRVRRSNRKENHKKNGQQQQQPAPTATLVDPFDGMSFLTGPATTNMPANMAMNTNFGGGPGYAPIGGGNSTNNLLGDLMSLSMSATSASTATKRELLSSTTGNGLEIQYSFLRQPSMYSPTMNLVQLWLANHGSQAIPRVQIQAKDTSSGKVVSFPEIPVLFPGSAPSMAQIHVDFSGQLDQVELQVLAGDKSFDVELVPVAGELLMPQQVSLDEFNQRLSMANQTALHTSDFFLQAPVQLQAFVQAALTDCNLAQVYEINNMNGATGRCKFAGRMRGGSGGMNSEVVLVGAEFQIQSGKTKLLVVTENASLAQRISASIKRHLPIRQG